MSGNTEGFIGILCAITLTAMTTFGVTQSIQSNRELEQLKIEFQGYRDGVKDSQ